MAVDVLKERGVAEERILFLNLISSPEGIGRFSSKFPKLHVITAFIDQVYFLGFSPRCMTHVLTSCPGTRREEVGALPSTARD